jgi:Lsr2
MAQKIQTLFIDDIDRSAAEGTVRFALDRTDYEIDLSAAHAVDLRAALAPFIAAGRKVPGAARRPGRAVRTAAAGGISTTEIREWARTQGIEVKDRGRMPTGIVARYREATAK